MTSEGQIPILLDALAAASDQSVAECVASLGLLAEDLGSRRLADWASETWQLVLAGDDRGVRESVRRQRDRILVEVQAELAEGRRAVVADVAPPPATPGPTPKSSQLGSLGSTLADPRPLVVLTFVVSAAAVAFEVASVVARLATGTFRQLFP